MLKRIFGQTEFGAVNGFGDGHKNKHNPIRAGLVTNIVFVISITA
jgi:hypothetical protein